MENKQIAFAAPDWLRKLKDEDIKSVIFALMFSWAWDNEEVKIPNLREYIKDSFDDLTDEQVEEVANLLIQNNVVKGQ